MLNFLKDAKDLNGGKSKHSLPFKATSSHTEGLKNLSWRDSLFFLDSLCYRICDNLNSFSGIEIPSSRNFLVYWVFVCNLEISTMFKHCEIKPTQEKKKRKKVPV